MYDYNTEIQEIADFTAEEIERKAEEIALLFEEMINTLLEQKIDALFEEE